MERKDTYTVDTYWTYRNAIVNYAITNDIVLTGRSVAAPAQ